MFRLLLLGLILPTVISEITKNDSEKKLNHLQGSNEQVSVWKNIIDSINEVYDKAGKSFIDNVSKKYNEELKRLSNKATNKKNQDNENSRREDNTYKQLISTFKQLSDILLNLNDQLNKMDDKNETFPTIKKALRQKRSAQFDDPIQDANANSSATGEPKVTFIAENQDKDKEISNQILSESKTTEPVTVQEFNNDENSTDFLERRRFYKRDKGDVQNYLNYMLSNNFQELTEKLQPLRQAKNIYKKYNLYQIGYIMANVDMLDINFRHLYGSISDKFIQDRDIVAIADTIQNINREVNILKNALTHYMTKNIESKVSYLKDNYASPPNAPRDNEIKNYKRIPSFLQNKLDNNPYHTVWNYNYKQQLN